MTNPFEQPVPPKPRPKPGVLARLRGSFLTGLVVIAPIGVTVWLFWTLTGWIDGWVMPFVPARFRPENLIGLDPRGVGVIIFLLFTVVVGWMAKGVIGRALLRWAESIVASLPVVRSVYSGLKQIAETIFAQTETSFEKACLVEYPRRGLWAVAFISTQAKGEVAAKALEPEMQAVFLPTTPNPTSGFLLFVPRHDVIELDMSVEEAAKLVISAGLVYPTDQQLEDREERRAKR